MTDCSKDVRAFHDQQVTLPGSDRRRMRDRRDTNRARLRRGLEAAGLREPDEFVSQGSYAMRTMVQDVDNDCLGRSVSATRRWRRWATVHWTCPAKRWSTVPTSSAYDRGIGKRPVLERGRRLGVSAAGVAYRVSGTRAPGSRDRSRRYRRLPSARPAKVRAPVRYGPRCGCWEGPRLFLPARDIPFPCRRPHRIPRRTGPPSLAGFGRVDRTTAKERLVPCWPFSARIPCEDVTCTRPPCRRVWGHYPRSAPRLARGPLSRNLF